MADRQKRLDNVLLMMLLVLLLLIICVLLTVVVLGMYANYVETVNLH